MTIEARQHLETQAWYYERWMFCRGTPGLLALRDGRLTFVTTAAEDGTDNWYEKVGAIDETIVDVALADLETVSYNWLWAGLTVTAESQQHRVCFAVRSGRDLEDTRRLITATASLYRWRTALQEYGVD